MPNRERFRSRSGYILLVVLGVLVLVVTVLGLLAKVSLRRGVQSVDAELALQQRWGAVSLQRLLLSGAPKIFDQRDKKLKELGVTGPPPPPFIRSAITIGDVTFDVMIADEDAKLNLNSIYHHAGPETLNQAITDIVPVVGRNSLRVMPVIKPLLLSRQTDAITQAKRRARNDAGDGEGEEERKPEIPPALRSWGEVFDLAKMSASVGTEAALPNLTTDMTCWGSGQLNIRRASDASISAVVGSVIQDGGAARFLKNYRDNPTSSLEVLLLTEVKKQGQRDELSEMLAEASTNFSLWIDASTKVGRPIRNFIVMRRDEEGVTRLEKFAH